MRLQAHAQPDVQLFSRRRKRDAALLIEPLGRVNLLDAKVSARQRAGLVEHRHTHFCGLFNCFTALDMNASARQSVAAAPENEWYGNGKRRRAADREKR